MAIRKNSRKRGSEQETRRALLTADAPFYYSEAYKMLRTNVKFVTDNLGDCAKIAITSAMPNEGKSVFAINLAITLSETGARVLLVDCDLRNPSVHRYLRVRESRLQGLSGVLSGSVELSDCIYFHPEYKFSFIAAGRIPPNPSELLGSGRMKQVVESLSGSFDYILFDTPPAGVVADSLVLSRFVDGTVLVVRQGASHRKQVRSVKEAYEDVNARLLGVVLTVCDMRDINDRYSSSYYYNYYGSRTSEESEDRTNKA